ncbi:hypothetical protein HD554DRAFT_2177402 [Boletus coccyginus]|nr:hypothetical protein HD554DRAFT_2177402 [Boletus coccyginus]
MSEHKNKNQDEKPALKGYVGFTHNSMAVLPNCLKIAGKFELSTIAQVTTQPILVVNLSLTSLKGVSVGTLLDHGLGNYFSPTGLDVLQISFDLGSDSKVNNWPALVSSLLGLLPRQTYDHVVFVITNHTDEYTGDLFMGKDENLKEFSAPIDQVLDTLLEPFGRLVPGSLVYLLACGSIVANKESFSLLCQTLKSLNVRHALAFDATHLVTSHAAGLLMKLSRNMLVHQIGFTAALEHLLQNESELGMHTRVVYITPNVVTRYIWSHRDIQP